ncbi:TetR/AcrR family transcriptional regulator [Phocaeicola barnesiae]|uniref:TetR/AcrR family transcriptional regulator n=1 Tax=Phocaeicola barnesiae TaxID=376804 RepID=UPI0025A34935|nr:TetR/AcrR family transcriptional regulator [Phocaeicola barnesiae]MDM8242893.1 TetR/AcrR family transcriptional regulator [Phocaeicola barnesiae]
MKDYDIDRILKPALKLFLTNNYEGVSTAKLEEETGLTRGAIFFKHKNKESLFKAVVDKYVLEFKPGSTEFKEVDSLKDFIDMFLLDIERRMNEMHSLGIPDVHRGYFNLLYQALKYYPGADVMISEMLDRGVQIWENIIQKAKISGEITPTCNVHETALQFKYLYSGMAVEKSFRDGLQVSSLRNLYYSLYKELRNEK